VHFYTEFYSRTDCWIVGLLHFYTEFYSRTDCRIVGLLFFGEEIFKRIVGLSDCFTCRKMVVGRYGLSDCCFFKCLLADCLRTDCRIVVFVTFSWPKCGENRELRSCAED